MEFLEILKAALIGVIQGVTEWLPISSTGHMILADEWIQLVVSPEFKEMFFVVIQLGSILAVAVLYFHKLNPFSPRKTETQRKQTWTLWFKVAVGAVPAGLAGVFLDGPLEKIFYKPVPVAISLIVYGVLYIILEDWNKKRYLAIDTLEKLTFKTAFFIGAFQILALIPGTSRSGSTILGAMIVGTSRSIAAEFSFFLAIPMMLGASGVKLLKLGFDYTSAEWGILAVGTAVAFVVSLFAVRFLVGFVRKHDFKPFGWYRIALGAVVLLYFMAF